MQLSVLTDNTYNIDFGVTIIPLVSVCKDAVSGSVLVQSFNKEFYANQLQTPFSENFGCHGFNFGGQLQTSLPQVLSLIPTF